MVNGILNVYKEKGYTSHDVVAKLRGIVGQKKIGHTGTLDPDAEGVLPVCLGRATKVCDMLTEKDKTYEAVLLLGKETDTQDISGTVLRVGETEGLTQEQVKDCVMSFVGEYDQIPPMYSALKVNGKKLYELAREGIEIEREARVITIFDLTIQPISHEELQIVVTCSKGTYIRVLGEDIAKALGTVGHLTALRRTATGDFSLENAMTLADFEQLDFDARFDKLLPVDECVKALPKLQLDAQQAERIKHGQRLNVKTCAYQQQVLSENTQEVRLFWDEQFLGIANLESNGRLQPIKLVNL